MPGRSGHGNARRKRRHKRKRLERKKRKRKKTYLEIRRQIEKHRNAEIASK